MLSKRNIALVAAFAASRAAADTIGAAKSAQGVTEIFGNSFGRPGKNATYDYIIIGGGTAGNTVAARLALDPANYTVAVVEGGNFYEIMNGNLTQIPGYAFMSAEPNIASGGLASLTALGLATEPQAGYNGRSISYTVGQTFGGGSAANTGGYQRPTKGALDWWAKTVGDDYWTWDNVFPFYKKSCQYSPPDYTRIDKTLNISQDANAFDSAGGPLHVSFGNFQGPFGPSLEQALDRLGFTSLPGLSSGDLLNGYGTILAGIDPTTATRSSSETSFLQAAAGKSALTIYPNTLAKRILFDSNKKATGVLVQGNILNSPLEYQLSASKEVILSGGVWYSPNLLMLSGIGPKATLAKNGIDVVADVQGVGQNEWDSAFMSLSFKVNVTTNTQLVAGNPEFVDAQISEYLNNQAGRLSGIGAGQAVAYEKFPENLRSQFSKDTLDRLSEFPDDWPEVQYLPLEEGSFPSDLGPDDNYLEIGAAMLAILSRGNMTLRSNDVTDKPVISPNWLLDVGDQEQAVAAFKRIRQIASNSSIVLSEFNPGPSVNTDEEILAWLQGNMNLIYHGTSTCRMGPDSDEWAVTDSRARVRGVTGLRVVDASAMPFLTPGLPMGTVYMFAEAIANSILSGQ